ncbi:TetR/AcrR family transcriptional regulator [Beijerinckia indica]|uniref:Transcriptional regulator, TetR family n=1 Tax=Beijerinckia indica subsp. indica (strain ATCC 9039 / DSM 1715 / NCIMB 8712) TaxID=395963 RepID=B2IG84_BEII9|nr:TetR/AcrR family transcriptional regulator [Beijerinckia indica]ACB97158.1 transcriptional regulator, TetR family [Beijerinckia indica subsp. indica ATCC 9039]
MRPRQPPQTVPTTDVRILDIAAEHIRRHGLARMTVTRIAEEAGMSHANIYRYYPSKEALIEEITAAWLKPLEAGLRMIADAPDPAFDKLERLLFAIHRAYRAKLENDAPLFDLFLAANDKNAPIARKHRNRCRLEIQRTLEEGASGGLFAITDMKKAKALVLDALYRFLSPAGIVLDAEESRAGVEARMQTLLDLVQGALTQGRY